MPTYPEIFQEVLENAYYKNRKIKLIEKGIQQLEAIPTGNLNDVNKNKIRALLALLEMKLATERIFVDGFTREKALCACRVIDQSKETFKKAQEALDPTYVSETDKFAALKESVMEVADYVDEINRTFAKLLEGGSFRGGIADYYQVKEKYLQPRQREWAQYFPWVDNKEFNYISVNGELGCIVRAKADALALSMKVGVNLSETAYRETLDDYDYCDILPAMVLARGYSNAPIFFVSTPFEEEFDVLLNANRTQNGIRKNIVQLDVTWLKKSKGGQNDVRSVFSRALITVNEERNPDIIGIYGLNELDGERRKGLYLAISEFVRFTEEKIVVAIQDASGDMIGLEEYQELARENDMVGADNKYLRLPSFGDYIDNLSELSEEQKEEMRSKCAFAGYAGLNRFIKNSKSNYNLAMSEAKEASDLNLAKAENFLGKLIDPSKIMPYDWKWKREQESKRVVVSGAYDYDKIRDVSDDKIIGILANTDFDIYQRCGELVKYCLLADEDCSVWKENLDEEERTERMKIAIRIIAYTMKVYYDDPKVEIVHDNKGSWGGLCVNGGETLRFKAASIPSINWTMDAILHELFHALQFTILDKNTGVDPMWYKKTYHLSNERIETWRDNESSGNYVDIDTDKKAYWLQTLEADARDFAGLCLGDQVYHEHDTYRK